MLFQSTTAVSWCRRPAIAFSTSRRRGSAARYHPESFWTWSSTWGPRCVRCISLYSCATVSCQRNIRTSRCWLTDITKCSRLMTAGSFTHGWPPFFESSRMAHRMHIICREQAQLVNWGALPPEAGIPIDNLLGSSRYRFHHLPTEGQSPPQRVCSRGCHGYIPEEYIHALYPYPLRIRAKDAYSKCIMRKREDDISILSDINCKIISGPYSRYNRQNTGIH